MKVRQRNIVAALLVGIISLFILTTLMRLLTQLWWFDTVGYGQVFWTRITWQVLIWFATAVIYFAFLWGNYWLAQSFTRDRSFSFFTGSYLELYNKYLVNYLALVIIFVAAWAAATESIPAWETILKYIHSTLFQLADPIYQKDISFYFFQLPLYESILAWLSTLLIAALVLSLLIYIFKETVSFQTQWRQILTGKVKTHLSFLLAGIAFLNALGFWLRRYELLYSPEGVVFGAGYTDVHAKLIAYWVMAFATFALAIIFLVAVYRPNLTLPGYGIALYLAIFIFINGIYPLWQQRFVVEPNELEKEKPYIENNIQFTRNAYNLQEVQRKDYPAEAQLNRQILQENESTVRNIRLWDYRPLLRTYRQLQEIRLYYKFSDVDIDRYTFDGNYRQVMLSPRELSYSQVSNRARTWVNKRLKYTHGYGLAMSPVNTVAPDGLPELFIKDIPPVSTVDLTITQPRIYYGEETKTYIFTGTSTKEFDYPLGEENAFNNYDGKGGVSIASFWRRLVYAYNQRSIKILLSDYFTKNSRIHYHRSIKDRVQQIAPFLRFDDDPYIAVIEGKLTWIIDAYTTSDRYPYSEPLKGNQASKINYIRNSVKVIIDAYDGTMTFFVIDEIDPVLATYQKIFPNLFTSKAKISPQIKAHFRYPSDLFKIQAQMYLAYHMSNPQVFYNREDLWRFPTTVYEGKQETMEPYYLIMRLPGELQEEFVLISPFTPVNKDNMIAWMTARSDGENYGKLLLYKFPKQELVYGPSQIVARVNQTPEISEQLTLWSQEGSRVIRGDLLVIPIEESLLYIEPVYLRAEQGELPELKRVILAYDKNIVMEESLEEAFAAIFGEKQTTAITNQTNSDLANSAWAAFQKAKEALRIGNWSDYGRYQQELENLLQQLSREEN
ncbi:MAG: UPF0182 family protein [Spirulinaceae cyanobacterium]